MRTTNEDVGAPVQSWARQVRWGFAIVLAASLVAACDNGGGGGGGGGGPTNHPPVASAGPAQSVAIGQPVTLDGSASTDADGDALSFRWSLASVPTGSTAVLTNASTLHPTFTPDMAGDYVVRLIVWDSQLAQSEVATVTVTVSIGNRPPVASAGSAQSVTVGATVTLDGSGSADPDGDTITYQWSLTTRPGGSSASLTNATSVNPTFTADAVGDYVAQLVVNDGHADSAAATLTIHAAAANVAPVANAGPNQNVGVGADVALNGAGSTDANGDTLTYRWSLTTRPGTSSATLTGATTATPHFTADVAGDYVAQLIVNDGHLDSPPATVTITATVGNVAPVANAGTNQTAIVGHLVNLHGTANDPDTGDTLSYTWTFTSVAGGSTLTNANITNANTADPSFTPDQPGDYVLRLVVNDGHVDSAPATVTITANPNTAPVANAGAARMAMIGVQFTLDGSASSDADGDSLTYVWTITGVPGGSTVTTGPLANPTPAHPVFTPDVLGDYVIQLVVNDGMADSPPATVTITAATFLPSFALFNAVTGVLPTGSADPAAGGNINFAGMVSTPISVPPVNVFSGGSSAGKLRLYKSADGTYYTVYYNGNSSPDADIDLGNMKINNMTPTTSSTSGLQRYISVPYTATTGPVTVTAYYTFAPGGGITCTAAHLMLVKKDGTILTNQSVCSATTKTAITATFTDAANTEVFLLFARSTDGGGGIQLSQIDLVK